MKISYLKFGQQITINTENTSQKTAEKHLHFLRSKAAVTIGELISGKRQDKDEIKRLKKVRDADLNTISKIVQGYPDLSYHFNKVSPYHFLMSALLLLDKDTVEMLVTESIRLSKIVERLEQEDLLQQFVYG